jgi:Fe-Mn family superoxide dismutase
MRLHHQKHHQGYLDKLNAALAAYPDLHDLSIEEILLRYAQLPADLQPVIRTQGGGHANHQFFWKILNAAPGQGPTEAVGPVAEAIRETFGSFNTFQAAFTDAALQVFGSGWAFLVLDPQHGSKLKIHTTANQDSVLLEGLPGLLCCDVWEHAYYLKYQNRRADYLAAFWNVVDWEIVGHRLAGMQAGKKQL